MTVKELIDFLSDKDPETEIIIPRYNDTEGYCIAARTYVRRTRDIDARDIRFVQDDKDSESIILIM